MNFTVLQTLFSRDVGQVAYMHAVHDNVFQQLNGALSKTSSTTVPAAAAAAVVVVLHTINFPTDDMNFTVQLIMTGSQQFGRQGSAFTSQLGTIQLHPSNDGLFVIGSLNTSMGSGGHAEFSGMAMQPVQVGGSRSLLCRLMNLCTVAACNTAMHCDFRHG
jgi:hypothetical protein